MYTGSIENTLRPIKLAYLVRLNDKENKATDVILTIGNNTKNISIPRSGIVNAKF